MQRWQQGYRLREVTREWGHLHLCLVDELESYSTAHPDLEPGVMPTAWRALAELCSQGVSESTTQYFQLQKVEAAGHVRDMEQTLEEVQELERRRAELFRQAAHDLRGNVGVVKNVTTGLTQDAIPEAMRDEFLRLLQRSVSSLNSMLDEVMDLARLQAGHELRDVKPFDAAVLLRELFENLQPLAAERGLFLKADGPDTLTVEGDAVKIRRIAQNLLLNALKYTQEGGVTLGWGDSRNNDPKRWMLCVQDTGPGIHAGPGAPLVEALQEATTESRQVDENAAKGKEWPSSAEPVPSLASPPDRRRSTKSGARASGYPSSSACANCWTRVWKSSLNPAKARRSESFCHGVTMPPNRRSSRLSCGLEDHQSRLTKYSLPKTPPHERKHTCRTSNNLNPASMSASAEFTASLSWSMTLSTASWRTPA